MLGPVHAQFFDLCNGLKCETCLHSVKKKKKWNEGPAVFLFFFLQAWQSFKNVKVQ